MHIFEAWFFIDRNKQNIVKIKRSPNRKKSLHKNNHDNGHFEEYKPVGCKLRDQMPRLFCHSHRLNAFK